MSHRILHRTVMARLAFPGAKRARSHRLAEDFGIRVPVETIDRMMDPLDDDATRRMPTLVSDAGRSLVPGDLEILYFDCTTLDFESVREDTLREFGTSKDGTHHRVQVLLALAVTREGLPIGSGAAPGSTGEGARVRTVRDTITRRWPDAHPVPVGDAGMLSEANLTALEETEGRSIIGVQFRSLQAPALDGDRYRSLAGTDGLRIGVFRHLGRRRVGIGSPKRCAKDAADRARALAKLIRRLGKSTSPKAVLGTRGTHRFLRVEGTARLGVDADTAARWDGLKGVVTHLHGIPANELLTRTRDLWRVEESFRVTRHDLRTRCIFHWTPRLIKAHLAIAFMASIGLRHLEYRLRLRTAALSPRRIRDALVRIQSSILEHSTTRQRSVLPGWILTEAKTLDSVMGMPLSDAPYALTKPEKNQEKSCQDRQEGYDESVCYRLKPSKSRI